MMKIPKIYGDWVVVLQALKNHTDDTEVRRVMKAGTIPWQSGVAERFTKRLLDAVNARLDQAVDTFQKQMKQARGQDSALIQALLQLRREFIFLEDILDFPAVPEEQRKQFVQLVKDEADKMQQSFEDSARRDRSGKLSSIVRNHPVNR